MSSTSAQTFLNVFSFVLLWTFSVVELDGELEDARVVTCRGDSSEVPGIPNLTGNWIKAAGRGDSVEVGDWIGEIDVVKQIEHFGAKFDVPGFVELKALREREIDVGLYRAA